jgi:hypothetical protein
MVFQQIPKKYRKHKNIKTSSFNRRFEGSKRAESSEVLMAKAIPWRSWIFTPGEHGNYQPAYVPGRIMSNHPPGPHIDTNKHSLR